MSIERLQLKVLLFMVGIMALWAARRGNFEPDHVEAISSKYTELVEAAKDV